MYLTQIKTLEQGTFDYNFQTWLPQDWRWRRRQDTDYLYKRALKVYSTP